MTLQRGAAIHLNTVVPRVASYGSWKSPISTDMIVSQVAGLGRIALDGDDTYWAELRPWEEGRNIIVKHSPNSPPSDVTPSQFSVGTTVHEYGARGFTVTDGVIYFSNYENQRLYKHEPGNDPVSLTPEGDMRYAGPVVDLPRERIICVRENHMLEGDHPVNRIVSIATDGSEKVDILVTGNDFYAMPRLSPDGSRLAWLTWNSPNMPWDGTELWVANFDSDGLLKDPALVAGDPGEAIIQPEWSPDGTLYFVSDRSRWANLYRWRRGEVEAVLPKKSEFAKTHWWVGMCGYGFESASTMVCSYVQRGISHLACLHLDENWLEPLDIPYSEMAHGDLKVAPGRVVFEAGSPQEPMSVLELNLETRDLTVLRRASAVEIDPGYVSVPETVEFPTEKERTAFAFYYPPKNKDFAAPIGERPPLLVTCHGGPHSAASTELNLSYQYWTSRGVGVLDVNYGGSTGYGREYRERLIGEWGVVDVDDCVHAARYLVERDDADGARVVISGGSAGGFTALAAMTFRDVFQPGASHFGVSDLEALLEDIHKFDADSLVGLVGPYPLYKQRYIERSPINFVEQINCPVILFQGLDDTIVPADQSEMMFDALKERGVPCAYIAFEGEAHGFTQSENIKRSMEAELYFYSKVFGFPLADEIEPVEIENL